MVAGQTPSPVRDHSELIQALVQDRPGAHEALLAYVADLADTTRLETLLAALKDESERMLVIDPGASERLADALVVGAEAAARPNHAALGLMARGDARRAQGHFPDAIALYDQAAQACRDIGDEVGWARSRIGFVFAAQFCGRGREALAIGEDAYLVLDRRGEHLRAGSLSNNMGTVHYQLGQYEHALSVFDRAIAHFRQAHAARPELAPVAQERIAKALCNKALVLVLQARFDEAIALCERAREIFVSVGELAQALRADHYRASIYAGRGQYTRALRIQDDALQEFERAGLDEAGIEVTLDLIASHVGLNRHADALSLAEDLVSRCEALGTPTEAAKARFRSAQALTALGQTRRAMEALDAAADVFSRAGLSAELGTVALLRARLHLAAGNWAEALSRGEEAAHLLAQHGLVERQAEADVACARATFELGEADRAEALAHAALRASHELDALPLSSAALHVLGRVAELHSDRSRAALHYEAAIGALERVQSSLATELRTEFLGDKLELYRDAIECSLSQGAPEQAFAYLERAKSRALVDYLRSTPEVQVQAGSPDERRLLDELAVLREEHAWFYGRLHGTTATVAGEPPSEAERATLREAVEQRERRIVRLQDRLALLRHAEGLEALATDPATEPPRPPRLDAGTILLEYAFWEQRGVVFVVSNTDLQVRPLAIGTRGLHRLLGRWQMNLDSAARVLRDTRALESLHAHARGQLAELYRALIAPCADVLGGAERLVVVPYGPAHTVPFHALFDGQHHLVEHLEVWSAPSSSLFELCAQRPALGDGALVVGHSGGQLKGVIEEAQRVARLLGSDCFVEDAATRTAVLSHASGRRVVHLAAHGEARLDNPRFAHLTLADGQLSMADVFRLRLDGALVALSACETGRSAVVGGDELVGLSRGFLFAGASTLVQSLWRVDDASTARLMEQFYAGLQHAQTPGEALTAAQRELVHEGQHPYLWAPFQLVGYAGNTLRREPTASAAASLN